MYSFNLYHLLLLQSVDIEINRGPKKFLRLNICHWNVNGATAHDFVKVALVEALTKANYIDIICLSQTFLDSTIPLYDERLYIEGCCMVRADHLSNTKRGGVCIYYKEY